MKVWNFLTVNRAFLEENPLHFMLAHQIVYLVRCQILNLRREAEIGLSAQNVEETGKRNRL